MGSSLHDNKGMGDVFSLESFWGRNVKENGILIFKLMGKQPEIKVSAMGKVSSHLQLFVRFFNVRL